MAQAQIPGSMCFMSFNVFNQRGLLAKNVFRVELSVCDEPTHDVKYSEKIYRLFSANAVERPLNEYNRQFAICEYCYWCAFFVKSVSEDTINDDSLKICPMYNKDNSVSLMQKNEAYRISLEDKRGLEIQFLKLKTLGG